MDRIVQAVRRLVRRIVAAHCPVCAGPIGACRCPKPDPPYEPVLPQPAPDPAPKQSVSPLLSMERPFAVHARGISGEFVRGFRSELERDFWLFNESFRGTEVLGLIDREPAESVLVLSC